MYPFKKIFIDQSVAGLPLTDRVRRAFPSLPVEIISGEPKSDPNLSIAGSKKILYLTAFKGQLIKPCPGTREYICCGYQILNTATNCPFDCSYCILQAYFNQPYIRIFANLEDIFFQLRAYGQEQAGRIIRLGTGEFTDSLAFDPFTHFSVRLAEEIKACPNLVLELKTKSRAVENLLELAKTDRLIISWSLNPEKVIAREERGAAGLNERLDAAAACQEQGFRLGFHFDPIFYFPGWEKEYRDTVDRLFRRIDPERIAWISLGCFRYLPPLAAIIRNRFPRADYIHEEFIPALDGKKRYPQSLRVDMYSRLLEWLAERGAGAMVYLCMENPAVWRKVFGFVPGEGHPSLSEMLDSRTGIKSP
ncbi:MAG: radical SAM protein [Deltaproteobacteria bacterium]|nr:radical SAM protein [Deltaproteobacteria bacterium]